MRWWLLAAAALTFDSAWAQQRLALVVGNDNYEQLPRLRNARADARAMADALRGAGYQVDLKTDRSQREMLDDVRALRQRIQGGNEVVFFFSGHGVQIGASNHLLPMNVRIRSEDQVRDDALELTRVLADLRTARPSFTLAIIDACRDNPFVGAGRTIGGRGLTGVAGANGQMVIYAAGEGQQALDRLSDNDPDRNGLFTRVFTREMQKPGVPVHQVLRNVRVEVARLALTVGHVQVPAIYDQVLGDFYFVPRRTSSLLPQIASATPEPQRAPAATQPAAGSMPFRPGPDAAVAQSPGPAGTVPGRMTQLVVYTALEADQFKTYEDAFNRSNPDISIRWVRDSTNAIIAKLIAEKAKPQADVVMGVAASSLAVLDMHGMLEPYKPLSYDAITVQYRDRKSPPAWWGMDAWGAAVCFNTVEAQRKGIPRPETWMDLTKPVYKGHVAMPNPASSGTGYLDVAAWLVLFGDDGAKGGGWKYMDALHENVALYTQSGSRPCNMASSGESVVGISFESRAIANKGKGAPIDIVFPKKGLGWDLEAFAIHKGTSKLDAAKRLADWASSRDAMVLYGKNFAITARPGLAAPLANLPTDYEARLVKMDFGWSGANRERILAEWVKRYHAKVERR